MFNKGLLLDEVMGIKQFGSSMHDDNIFWVELLIPVFAHSILEEDSDFDIVCSCEAISRSLPS